MLGLEEIVLTVRPGKSHVQVLHGEYYGNVCEAENRR